MYTVRFSRCLYVVLLVACLAVGCASPRPAPVATTSAPPPTTATKTLAPTATIPPATPTLTASPSATPRPTLTFTPTPSPFPTLDPALAARDYLKQASQLVEAGDVDHALLAIDQAIRLEPLAINPYYQRTRLLGNWKTLQAAADNRQTIQRTSEALQQDSNNPALYLQRAQARIALAVLTGQPHKSTHLTSLPGDLKVEGGLTVSNLVLRDALSDLEQAIQLDPSAAEVYHLRGLARHLQALSYYQNTLIKADPQQIQQAITDYRNSLQMDPSQGAAWNDLGAALLHQHSELSLNYLAPVPDATLKKTQADAQAAVEALGKAIQLQPGQADYHTNRALAYFMLLTNKLPNADEISGGKASEESGNEVLDTLQNWWEDANRAMELDPDSSDAVMLRYVAEVVLGAFTKDTARQAEYDNYRDQDEAAIQAMTGMQAKNLGLPAALTSAGAPSLSEPNLRLQGKLENNVYYSPDNSWSLNMPRLDDLSSVTWDVQSPLGQQAVYITDDIGRDYQLFVLPPGDDMELGLALLQQVVKDNPVDKELSFKIGKSLEAQGYLYYDREIESQCAAAVLPGARRQVAAVYCLYDQAPDVPGASAIRSGTKIPYQPVEKLLEDFMNDWKMMK